MSDHCLISLRQFEVYTNTIVSIFETEQISVSSIMLVLALSPPFNAFWMKRDWKLVISPCHITCSLLLLCYYRLNIFHATLFIFT